MKIKPLIITFESLEDFAQRTKQALADAIKFKKKTIQRKNNLIWASPEAYQQFMSDQKYAILAVIIKHKPQSVYQLAKILNRAQQNVARDCDLLEGHGFIKFEQSEDGRKAKVPLLAFDYNSIMVCLPSVTYKVEFEEAA
jgi:predicted transcriptional regulator